MSDKPKIYGTCPAGCLWETVHKSDFERSAAFIKQYPNESGEYILEIGNTYIIKRSPTAEQLGYFKATAITDFSAPKEATSPAMEYPDIYVSYNDRYKVRFLHTTWNYNGSCAVTNVIETNGETVYPSFSIPMEYTPENVICDFVVTGATEVLLVNEHAEIRAKDAYEIAVEEGFEGARTEWLESLKHGPKGENGADGSDYELTEEDKSEIAEKVKNVVYAPKFVRSVFEMTDVNRSYGLESTKTLWTYSLGDEEEIEITLTHKIQADSTNNPSYANSRINYTTGVVEEKSGYVVSPFIDLNNYNGNTGTVKIRLAGLAWAHQAGGTNDTNVRVAQYDENQNFIITNSNVSPDGWTSVTWEFDDEAAYIIMNLPYKQTSSKPVTRYLRFCAAGTWSDEYISVDYQGIGKTPSGWYWRDTGIEYPPKSAGAETNISEFTLINPSVKAFMETADYSDDDYSYTQVTDYAGSDYFRKDQPFPVFISWNKAENAVQYTISINTSDKVLNTGMQTYYAKNNSISLYNLIPNKTYWYKVCALCANGTKSVIKDGSFETTAEKTRLLKIDGIQNVRDIGGYTGKDGKTVKYGLVIRGSAMDEAARNTLNITGEGAEELTRRVGVRTDIDLRAGKTDSAIVDKSDFLCVPYGNYAVAVADTTQLEYFKILFEYIVERLTNNRPVYIHCQGGCDRTGTLIFLLLGLLGVSESDLAREYELSSFSSIGGRARTRNSETYNYKGMVTILKAYLGETFSDKFVSFATACGIDASTVENFRALMLE